MELEPRWRVILYRQPLVSLEFVGDPPICRKFIDTIQGTNNSEALRFKRTAFYNGLKSKIGLAAAKTAALRVNLNVQGCGIVSPPMHGALPLALPFCSPSFFHTISLLPAFTSA